ncbi:fidgetin-like protein 1 [Megalops cyprinoides]|uniref:fidgetin-like protein 1 n=1 Tax=Megalops cyprinoides TaxID=118141 RepID=UPI0018653B52|nr:fidgetin-like protein 1 [Megalops cyprinoides]
MHSAHLSEWQRRSFDISSGTCSPEQQADTYRAHILGVHYAWMSTELLPATVARLLGTYSEQYAAVMDSDNPHAGLNNYADSALHLARGQKNNSDRWQSSLLLGSVLTLPCVQRMARGGRPPIAVADAHIVVGGATAGGNASTSPSPPTTGARLVGLHLVASPGDPDASERGHEVASISYSVTSSHASAPTFSSLCKTPPAATPIFGANPPCCTGPLSQVHANSSVGSYLHDYQPRLFTSLNFAKRKTFYGLYGEDDRGSGLETTRSLDGPGRKGEHSHATSFRSAREQLAVTQQKKHNQQPQRGHLLGPPITLKKSLGANRSRGAFSKFVSPMPRQEVDGYGGDSGRHGQAAQPVDDRLKNFEPKIIELIMSEIMDHGPPVAWDDIAGLEFAKATIKEIVVWPMLRPDIFTGLRGPPKGILLFGPPGTGKTLIGKCIACQSGATFFSISASSLTSKWVGEGEKMVRALFAIARCHQPAVIFIDEIDSLLSQRTDGEHDSSRRIKTEFLVQLDGAATAADDRILVVGATNRPQEIDEAARRRLAKRLYVALPEAAARQQIVARLMSREKCRLESQELEHIVDGTEGFSGADMTQLCREAALGPIRSIQVADIATISPEQVRPILYTDFLEALKTVRPSVSPKDLQLYEEWNKTFGCGR